MRTRRWPARWPMAMFGAVFLVSAGAGADDVVARAALMARIEAAQADGAARAAVIRQGRDFATFCAYCHGEDGNSERPDIPNLAGQNPAYLLDQIEKFASGERQDFTTVMQQLARRFTPDETVALVVYYSSMPLRAVSGDPALASSGRSIYLTQCRLCHGPDGRGTQGFARVAGQKPAYVRRALSEYRDKKGGRVSAAMSAVTRDLSDADIAALAAFVAGLR